MEVADEGLHDPVGAVRVCVVAQSMSGCVQHKRRLRLRPPLTRRPRRREMTIQPSKELEELLRRHMWHGSGVTTKVEAHLSADDPIIARLRPDEQMTPRTPSPRAPRRNSPTATTRVQGDRSADHRRARVGRFGWTLTESGGSSRTAATSRPRTLGPTSRGRRLEAHAASQHPRSPTTASTGLTGHTASPRLRLAWPYLKWDLSIVADRHVPVPAAAGLTRAQPAAEVGLAGDHEVGRHALGEIERAGRPARAEDR